VVAPRKGSPEMLPDAVEERVRFPRRRAGRSPQDMATIVVLDYTASTRAWLPTAAIVALLAQFDVTAAAARMTISRLVRRGILEGRRQSRHSFYRLTRSAAADLSIGGTAIATFGAEPEPWDGSWTVVMFTVPEEAIAQRRALRGELRWRGYAPLYDGVWVSPHPMTAETRTHLSKAKLGALTVLHAQHCDLQTGVTRNPVEAWDLTGIVERYEQFIQHWDGIVATIKRGAVTGAAALRARTEMVDAYRGFLMIDPRLPAEVMQSDWPRAQARDLFVAVYDGLADPAQQYVREVVAGVDNGSSRGIRAHTVAELAAGIDVLTH
jgi:phenylacetic acid degradation operon negative regulatory protein